MIQVAIVEDEPAAQDVLLSQLHRYERDHDVRMQIRSYSDGNEIAEGYTPGLDIILLDIEMEHLDGLSTARIIRELDAAVVLIFITNAPQHAIKGYEVNALSYLVKPVNYLAMSRELDRALEAARKSERRSILISARGEVKRIDIADILYFESVKHYLVTHTFDGTLTSLGTLREMEAQLRDKDFFRSNSGYLINLRHVVSAHNKTTGMANGEKLQVSRQRWKPFLEALSDYIDGIS